MRIFLSCLFFSLTFAQTSCNQNENCADSEFCRCSSVSEDFVCTGVCTACTDSDSGNNNPFECIEDAANVDFYSKRNCQLKCEYEAGQMSSDAQVHATVSGPDSYTDQLVSDLEGSLCTNCCASGSAFAATCPIWYQANPCRNSFCDSSTEQCMWNIEENYSACTAVHEDVNFVPYHVLGYCMDGHCIVQDEESNLTPVECPPGQGRDVYSARIYGPCGSRTVRQDFEFSGQDCPDGRDGDCDTFGAQWDELWCWTSSFADEENTFVTKFHDPDEITEDDDSGRCIIGETDDCVIQNDGFYSYRDQEIAWKTDTSDEQFLTYMVITHQTKTVSPSLTCEDGKFCRGHILCHMYGNQPCERTYAVCLNTHSPTEEPTGGDISTAHGDPIIWTFNDECYDLNKDGKYLATSHPSFDHEVSIAVYNDFMREVQVTNNQGKILLSINNLGEVLNNDYPYYFSEETVQCPLDSYDCPFSYKEFRFDAQNFEYIVQIMVHDYLDAALQPGVTGFHLDIFPIPYQNFAAKKNSYTGLYFENPLPEELEYCPEGSIHL